jgi:hypothetical protein
MSKIKIVIVLFICQFAFSQTNTSSPYSFFGIGTPKFTNTNDLVQMGSSTVYADSIHINPANPATYGKQLLTSFQVGGAVRYSKYIANSTTDKSQVTSFDYLVIGLPYSNKLGFTLGVTPQTAVGYSLSNVQTNSGVTESRVYQGEGGINKGFVGAGYQLYKGLSVGFEFQYLFGKINSNSRRNELGVLYGTQELNESVLRGATFNAGLFYEHKLKKQNRFISSVTFSPKSKINSENQRVINLYSTNANGSISPVDIEVVDVPNNKLTLPSNFSAGVGFGNRKYFVTADAVLKGASDNLNRFDNFTNVQFGKSTKFGIGGFYIPNFNSFTNYLERVTYRAGFTFEDTGLKINGQNIKDSALNLGLGLPIPGTFSAINIGFQLGQRGTTQNALIKENYYGFNGLVLNDKWFKKVLYN